MARIHLKERWIQAMSKIPYSLIGYNGYTKEDAECVCNLFRRDAPEHPQLEKVLALEVETKDLPMAMISESETKRPFTKNDSIAVLETATKPITISKTPKPKVKAMKPSANDFLEPWIRVTNLDGVLLRYEDANGRPIPKVLWRIGNKPSSCCV